MKSKIAILGVILLVLISCEKGIENPYSPELPDPLPPPISCELKVNYGIESITPFLNENDYCTFYVTVAGERTNPLDVSYKYPSADWTRDFSKTYNFSIFPEDGIEEKITYQLFTFGSSMGEWSANNEFECWATVTPISEGIRIEPVGEQKISLKDWISYDPDKPWESQRIVFYFKIIKTT